MTRNIEEEDMWMEIQRKTCPGDKKDRLTEQIIEIEAMVKRSELRLPNVVDARDVTDYLMSYSFACRSFYYFNQNLEKTWLDRVGKQEWMCEHLLSAGISACEFGTGTVCMSLLYGNGLLSALRASQCAKKREMISKSARELQARAGGKGLRRILIPLTDGTHWGVACIESCSLEPIEYGYKLWWGDSCGRRGFGGFESVINAVCKKVWPGKLKSIQKENAMTVTFNWEQQRDSWTCGCFMLMMIRSFALRSDYLPLVDMKEYDPTKEAYYKVQRGCRDAFIAFATVCYVHMGTSMTDEAIMKCLYDGVPIKRDGKETGMALRSLPCYEEMSWLGKETVVPQLSQLSWPPHPAGGGSGKAAGEAWPGASGSGGSGSRSKDEENTQVANAFIDPIEHKPADWGDSCDTSGDDLHRRVHYTDNPARYLKVLSNYGLLYHFDKEYVGKGKMKSTTSATYRCVCTRRIGFRFCPARLIISRNLDSAKFKIKRIGPTKLVISRDLGSVKFKVERIGMHEGHKRFQAQTSGKLYKGVLEKLHKRIETFNQALAESRTGADVAQSSKKALAESRTGEDVAQQSKKALAESRTGEDAAQ